MSRKSKGISAERELVHMFWGKEWPCIRVAGSGSIKYPAPDVIAGNSIRMIAIECKVTKENKQYLSKKEINELKEFSQKFGAEAWIAVKFNKDKWYFLNIEDIKPTTENFVITNENARLKGLLFEELVED